MIKYLLDVEQSKAVYNDCKPLLQMKMCYNNVFQVTTEYISKFRAGEWKVAYGYMTVIENVLCRHCFIIGENGKVIDPTIFTGSGITEREYYTMKVFDDIDSYFEAIENENYYPALDRYLAEQNKQANAWANKNGFILTG